MAIENSDVARALISLLCERRILVLAGSGGVGKTTVAAALAVEAARQGRRVLVLTIDPARRLSDALGIEKQSGDMQRLPEGSLERLGIHGTGSLEAMMLDMKSTFDGLVDRFADSETVKQRILENPIYQHVSDALAGSGEYAAMEKVYEVCESGRYDLVVLDTPPSQHALDFLDAPRRLIEFLDSRMMQLLLHPAMAAGRLGFRLFNRTGQRVLKLMERISGVGFLEDVSEFLLAFEGMSEGFRERAAKVRKLLLGPSSAFLVVSGPSIEASRATFEFLTRMRGTQVPVEGVLLNRARLWPDADASRAHLQSGPPAQGDMEALARALALASPEPDFDAELAARTAVGLAKGYASLVQSDETSSAPLREQAERYHQVFGRIPELPRDVCDLEGLVRIGDFLFRDGRP